MIDRLREARIRRVIEPIVAGEFPSSEILEDDIELVRDLGWVTLGPGGMKIANPIARQLIREEGLLVGGSSGSAVWGMMEAVKLYPGVEKVLTILPDSIRNYMTKFVDDDWMKKHGFPVEDREG